MSLQQRALSLGLPAIVLFGARAVSLSAQQPVTRAQAVAAALARGARAAFGRADTAAASGALHAARLYPNPTALGSYSRDVPHYHVTADLPLDLPWIRSARIGAAASARDAARYNFAFERAAIRFDVDTAYTRALAALARARLSRRNALDAGVVGVPAAHQVPVPGAGHRIAVLRVVHQEDFSSAQLQARVGAVVGCCRE